jgi:hypothetical protein
MKAVTFARDALDKLESAAKSGARALALVPLLKSIGL